MAEDARIRGCLGACVNPPYVTVATGKSETERKLESRLRKQARAEAADSSY